MTHAREEWRPVVGHEGLYEVSDQGRVRSLDRIVRSANGKVYARSGKVLKPRVDFAGRPAVALYLGGGVKQRFVSNLMMRAFVGERPPGMDVCHGDGNPANNVLSNLRYATRGENIADQVLHGTHPHARKTHCPRGHLLQEPNLRPSQLARGNRQCESCSLAQKAMYRARRSGRPFDLQAEADARYARIMEALLACC